ncbi:MAG: UPF0182 family membrane protein [Pyrinomonadaceae bacterium]
MTRPMPVDMDGEIIDVGTPARRHWRRWVILAIIALLFALSRFINVYVEWLWFDSLGYASVYAYTWRLQLALFAIFSLATLILLRLAFRLIEKAFASTALERRVVVVNNQPVNFQPARVLRPVGWAVSILFSIVYGLAMSGEWQKWALFLHAAATNERDPVFGKSIGFYLFALPVYQQLASWLTMLAFIALCAAALYALLALTQNESLRAISPDMPQPLRASAKSYGLSVAVLSCALAPLFMLIAWRVYLSRFPYLWQDHQTFSGVTYTEANYLLPGLIVVAVALIIAAVILLLNALTKRALRLLLVAVALPIIVSVIALIVVPSYVTSFIVKPNELGRETPYIEHNLNWTRRAFKIENVETRDFAADSSTAAFDLQHNRQTLDNIRLWDWKALQDTLKQIQEIRTYYDFPDVDVDRYRINGQTRQMMLAAREINSDNLPASSRNWVNEKLIYTHGYGVTMNPVNGFTAEGLPQFVLSNMPIESAAPEIKVTRPEIYFGQKTDTDVYVKTREKEFNYPQGEANNYSTYEGTGGIQLGNAFRRFLLAWSLDDLSKLPFSDQITTDSRVLMRRNISERVQSLAPFLVYDNDPYIVVGDDGRLSWMIDAYTSSANYPYSRHYVYDRSGVETNYFRNSVKVTIDAYTGAVNFYVFDREDPIINSYRTTFPALFHDAREMPADLRAHVRYPETLIRTQGEVFSLYHTQNAKVFFQREDVWSVARQINSTADKRQEAEPLDPYFVLMQLPGEQTIADEFVEILPFTPSNRNNMIGWMAGRSDGAAYGSLLVYNFPKSSAVAGPLQIEARIDQNAQLSSQLTLWNQQGSHVQRGNMLVIPIGTALLYVEPIYLKASSSPMPELRLVVLATADRLAYGTNFAEAMTNLFGESSAGTTATAQPASQNADRATSPQQQSNAPNTSQTIAPNASQRQIIERAYQEFTDWQRLTAEGRLREAGERLEAHKRTLEELRQPQR